MCLCFHEHSRYPSSLPRRSFVFIDIPASFLQKRNSLDSHLGPVIDGWHNSARRLSHIHLLSCEHPQTLRTVWPITDFSERALFYATKVAYGLEFVKESVRWCWLHGQVTTHLRGERFATVSNVNARDVLKQEPTVSDFLTVGSSLNASGAGAKLRAHWRIAHEKGPPIKIRAPLRE
jgi:hypothetical protein